MTTAITTGQLRGVYAHARNPEQGEEHTCRLADISLGCTAAAARARWRHPATLESIIGAYPRVLDLCAAFGCRHADEACAGRINRIGGLIGESAFKQATMGRTSALWKAACARQAWCPAPSKFKSVASMHIPKKAPT